MAQPKKYTVAVVAFYNLENLYDTINDPLKNDDEFLPSGLKSYNSRIYTDKLQRLANVIAKIGTENNPVFPDGPALLGVAEIENTIVLKDLSRHPLLEKKQYRYVHYESPDIRGIDVALLYNPSYFAELKSRALPVNIPSGSKDEIFTRDILWVKGLLNGETVHVYVNHWPSRRGGEAASAPARYAAARTLKKHTDSVMIAEPGAKIIIMGDLNDDPNSNSITKVLDAKVDIGKIKSGDLYNPWLTLFNKGIGSLAYNDSWNLFDQIIISHSLVKKPQKGFFFLTNYVYNKNFITEHTGRFKGYPKRTWDGDNYNYGYSDHYPTYIVLLKEIENK